MISSKNYTPSSSQKGDSIIKRNSSNCSTYLCKKINTQENNSENICKGAESRLVKIDLSLVVNLLKDIRLVGPNAEIQDPVGCKTFDMVKS